MRRISCENCSARSLGSICNVPPEAREDLQALGVTSTYKARQVIFSEGNPSMGLYLVCHGTVKLFHSDRFGRDHILEIVGPSAVLGELDTQGQRPLSVSAETLTEGQLCFLPRNALTAFLRRYPDTALSIIDALSRELSKARRGVRDLALRGAESRLASLLVQLASQDGAEISERVEIPYGRREMAELVGVSTETAIRLLGKLRDKGILGIDRRQVTLLDRPRLVRIAECNVDEPGEVGAGV